MTQALICNEPARLALIEASAVHCAGPDEIPASCTVCWVSGRRHDWPQLLTRLKNLGITSVLVSPLLQEREMQLAFLAGARGYCGETISRRQMDNILSTVSQSGIWVPESLLVRVVGNLAAMAEFKRHEQDEHTLTEREKEVTNGILDGQSNAEIAAHMRITERTVKQHISAILRKFGVRDRVGLLLKLGHFEKLS
ncbi:response regulator transcription factor [Salinimonas lutimaris]|uniref:response regulator transcription factor n=1 Tax=Salinimonas lutimaris TaxID=914153 RepID=UPI0010C0858B|nr:response regulator transcription factor [Salinimonas lutimaris]